MSDKSFSARVGHIKRHLNKNEPLEGKTLKFAIELFENSTDETIKNIIEKIKLKQPLTEYEQHIMVDVVLDLIELE
jgi:FKBP-type peptidyl-prolyl cis-trans isomerase 2